MAVMDREAVTETEIWIEAKDPPFWFRVCAAAAVVFYLVWEATGFLLKTDAGAAGDYWRLLFAFVIAYVIFHQFFFKGEVRWTLRSDEIQIDRSWTISERREVAFVKRGDVTKISIATVSGEDSDLFYIRLWLVSGQDFESPPISNARRSRELKAEIAKRLNVAHEDV